MRPVLRAVQAAPLGLIAAALQIAAKGDVSEFEIMFAEMEAWKATYYTTIIPRMVRLPS